MNDFFRQIYENCEELWAVMAVMSSKKFVKVKFDSLASGLITTQIQRMCSDLDEILDQCLPKKIFCPLKEIIR